MRSSYGMIGLLVMGLTTQGYALNAKETQLKDFIAAHIEKIKPLEKQANLAWWEAAVTGDPKAYDRNSELTLQLRQVYSNSSEFALLKDLKESGRISDPLLARQLTVLYNSYLSNQIEPDLLKQIVELGTQIEKNFSTFRGAIDGKNVTDNQIVDILKSETDSAKREQAWQASKQVGAAVAADLVRLVTLRNQAARKLGFDNYHTMSLATGEQDVKELDTIFNELYELTNEPFARLKAELDGILARKYGITPKELMPWHYHDRFFQEAPMVYDLDLDAYYKGKDVKKLAEEFYAGIGLPVEAILAKSDLYEKEGKNPHAFCTHIDREGDVRVLCNLKNDEYWMDTILHELGHGVYDKYLDFNTPYLLRSPAHAFTTEAVAMFFGRLSRNPAWMQHTLGLSDAQRTEIEKVSDKYAQLKQLIFARWDMVMYHFEKQLYANPDQDLTRLWWDLVEKYQMVRRPPNRVNPDWAAKIHFAIAPCYYHNYMLGEMLASQWHHTLVNKVLALKSDKGVSYIGRKAAGQFFLDNVFHAGALYPWNEMIRRSTGEPLTAKYFVQQFVK
ncbi:MAG: M2 family metallopeptidase [Sedimentisphaerales bacterium]|nr:M2 family metallopeptidase [Sedimentisphaerales bacterium]